MDKEKLLKEVVTNIRSCLVSTQGKCDLRQIRNDYRMLMGGEIPYVQLGFRNLEQFICSVPSLSTTRTNGQLLVDAKATEKSSHIASFVEKQKTAKKRVRPPPRRMPPRNNFNTFNGTSPPRWRPKNINNNLKKYQSSPRPAAVSHNQFVDIPVPKKQTVVPPRIANRLNVRREYSRTSSLPSGSSVTGEVEKHDYETDSLTSKARQRLAQRVARMSIDSSNAYSNGNGSADDNWNLENNVLSSNAINQLKKESLAAVDLQNPVWKWSSSEGSPESTKSATQKRNKNPPFERTDDHLADLERFVRLHNLGELVVKVFTRKVKYNKSVLYDCKIYLGANMASSWLPETDFTDERSAKQEAAKQLLETLMPKYNRPLSLLVSNEEDVLQRIPPIVKLHPNGIWNWQIEADYAETFNERLPINWLEIIDTIRSILVLPVLKNFVLRYCSPDEVFQKGDVPPPIIADVSVPSNTIKFDDSGSLLAEVTCVVSAGEIWCRQVSTLEEQAFLDMTSKLENHYNSLMGTEKIHGVEVGGYYVAMFENAWCRIRVIDVDGNEVNCFCIDFGDEWIVPKDCIYRLDRQFAKEQAQAFVCRLAGVEELYEASKTSEYLSSLQGKYVQVQLDHSSDDAEKSSITDPAVPVILYDDETGVTINEYLITCIAIESATPALNQRTPTEVYVTNATKEGALFVQVRSKGYEQLMSLLQEAEKTVAENRVDPYPAALDNTSDKLFLTWNNDTNSWCRAKINDWAPNGKFFQLYYVDYGTSDIVQPKNQLLYLLDDLSDIITKFPYQALKVHMLLLHDIPPDFDKKILRILPPQQPFLLKLIMLDKEKGPLVEIFKRSETENTLFSVNSTFADDSEVRKVEDMGSNTSGQSKKLQRLISLNQFDDTTKNVPSSGSLSCPPIPAIESYFDVKIPCAVHPHNFFVQPYVTHEKLNNLMAALQEKYKEVSYSPIQMDDVIPGKIYASKHEDGMWYRTSVIKVIHSGSISVFYCDFGYYANLTLQQLIPLDPEFMDLPHQAIKAKLAGIKPKNSKWSMDDCKFFEELVVRKSFVSLLVGIEKDVLYRSDMVLSLKLIDTSTNVDVYITKILVQKGIAVETQ